MTSTNGDVTFKPLNVLVIGGGLGGLAAAVALRRQGHHVSIYERRDFDVEVGASISCAANGTQWLREWDVDIPMALPVILKNLIMRDWKTGRVQAEYPLHDYEKTWGNVYNMFHREDMHKALLHAATSPEGEGFPAKCVTDHICASVDYENGTVTFVNGVTVKGDVIIGSDGIRSVVRQEIGVVPDKKLAPQTCYRCNVTKERATELGLEYYANEPAIQYWGGVEKDGVNKYYKIVLSPCRSGNIISLYCFMPTELSNHAEEGFVFDEVPISNITVGDYSKLVEDCQILVNNSVERRPWRLYVHQPYDRWVNGLACVLGDAAHPMLPHQSQGACQAIEDAAALGLIFSREHSRFTQDVRTGLKLYEQVRKNRATRVQWASARATEDINNRIGFSSLSKDTGDKLTIAEMNLYDMRKHVRELVDKL